MPPLMADARPHRAAQRQAGAAKTSVDALITSMALVHGVSGGIHRARSRGSSKLKLHKLHGGAAGDRTRSPTKSPRKLAGPGYTTEEDPSVDVAEESAGTGGGSPQATRVVMDIAAALSAGAMTPEAASPRADAALPVQEEIGRAHV